MTVFADISSALDSHLNDMALPTAWENNNFTPTQDQLYVRPTLLPGNTEQSSFNSSDEHLGIYQVDVIAPANKGKGEALIQADLIADQFKSRQILTYNGVKVYLTAVSRGNGTVSDGWYILPITAAYRAYTAPR
jgi:hypothetical protein